MNCNHIGYPLTLKQAASLGQNFKLSNTMVHIAFDKEKMESESLNYDLLSHNLIITRKYFIIYKITGVTAYSVT